MMHLVFLWFSKKYTGMFDTTASLGCQNTKASPRTLPRNLFHVEKMFEYVAGETWNLSAKSSVSSPNHSRIKTITSWALPKSLWVFPPLFFEAMPCFLFVPSPVHKIWYAGFQEQEQNIKCHYWRDARIKFHSWISFDAAWWKYLSGCFQCQGCYLVQLVHFQAHCDLLILQYGNIFSQTVNCCLFLIAWEAPIIAIAFYMHIFCKPTSLNDNVILTLCGQIPAFCLWKLSQQCSSCLFGWFLIAHLQRRMRVLKCMCPIYKVVGTKWLEQNVCKQHFLANSQLLPVSHCMGGTYKVVLSFSVRF